MTSLLGHLDMVSLRGPGYVFEYAGRLPNGLDETSRQLYMDAFILFALPTDPETVAYYRLHGVQIALEYCTRRKRQWFPSEFFSMKADQLMWTKIFSAHLSEGQTVPLFPWELPAYDPAGFPSIILQEWRRKMGLPHEYSEQNDCSSTELTLSSVSKMTTIDNVRAFLEKQQLPQWFNTRATIPEKARQQPVQETLVEVLRHISQVRKRQTGPKAEFFAELRNLEEKNPILRYIRTSGTPSEEEVAQLLCPDSGPASETVLDLLQCDLMHSTIWTLSCFHFLTKPVKMTTVPSGGFRLMEDVAQAGEQLKSTTTPFIEWDCSTALEDAIDAQLTPQVGLDGCTTVCIAAQPQIMHVAVKEASVDTNPPRELEVWISALTVSGIYIRKSYRQQYMLVGVVTVGYDGTHTKSLRLPVGLDSNGCRAPGQDYSAPTLKKRDSGLLMYAASSSLVTIPSEPQSENPIATHEMPQQTMEPTRGKATSSAGVQPE